MPRNWASFQPNGPPVIYARIGIDTIRTLIDTGAMRSLIAPALAARFRLPIMGENRIIGVLPQFIPAPRVRLSEVALASLALPPFDANVVELAHLRMGIQMILGINAFVDRRLRIDFKEGRVYFL